MHVTNVKGTDANQDSGEAAAMKADQDPIASVPKITQLKPQMESIFSEVEKSLPSIDFDLSDVSSDNEEPVIFHRSLKTTDYIFDDDKDLDTSLSGESLSDIFHPENRQLELPAFHDRQTDLSPPYDNDLAMLNPVSTNVAQPKSGHSWGDLAADYEREKVSVPLPQRQNWMAQTEIMLEELGKSSDPSFMLRELVRPSFPSMTSSGTSLDGDFVDNRLVDVEDMELGGEEPHGLRIVSPESSIEDVTVSVSEQQVEKKEDKKQFSQDIAAQYVSPSAPVLSLQGFENVDLDILLQSLNEDNQYAPQATHIISTEQGAGDMKEEQGILQQGDLTLIQKLAQLSVTQGGLNLENIDPRTGATNNETKDDEIEQEKIVKDPETKKTSSMGVNTNDLRRQSPVKVMTASKPPKKVPETVYIDLRNFEKQKLDEQHNIERVQKILGIQKESSDSSDSEDEVESWQKQRQKIKQTLISRGVSTEPLPSKTIPKPSLPRDIKHPTRVINLSDRKSKSKQGTNTESQERHNKEEAERMQKELEVLKEKEKKMEMAKKLREQREKEREAHIRMGSRIEAVRPTASVSGRHACAENTPTLFDIEASYEPAPKTLPRVISPEQERLLLTVNLSNNGEIILHRNKTNRSVDTGCGLSASYTALLTWLLSLVPDDFTFLQEKDKSQKSGSILIAPFHVIGLQQMWVDKHLCLVVTVTPVKEFDAKSVPFKGKKSRVRDELKGSSPFAQHVTKFLASNSLQSVCPWLQALVSMDVTCAGQDDPNLSSAYIYQPPLPNITTKPLSTFVHCNPDHTAVGKIFDIPIGFFWQTVDSDDGHFEVCVNDNGVNYETQNTMSLIYKKIFHDPSALMGILNRVLQEGLDLCGIRLLYPTAEQLNLKDSQDKKQSDLDLLNNIGPVLAIALRGTFARSIWLDAVGPSDPALARRTDPMSLCAQFGGASRDECLLFCPRNPARVHSELARWFGGRVPPGGVIDVGTPYTRKETLRTGSPKGRKGKKGTEESVDIEDTVSARRPPATLTATHKSDIFLILSPLVPLCSYGLIISTCQRRGYQIHGVKRLKLSTKKATMFGVAAPEMCSFCPGTQAKSDEIMKEMHVKQQEATVPSTVLVLQKENSSHNAASLIEAFMIQLTLQGILGHIQQESETKLSSKHLFHASSFSDGLLNLLGGDFSKCPDYDMLSSPSYLQPQVYTNPEVEQVAVLILFGHEILKSCGLVIGKILNLVPHSKSPTTLPLNEGFELLGMKWLPSLAISQAREITPYEVGDKQWRESIHTLTSEPLLILAVRGVDAYRRLTAIFPDRCTVSSSISPRGQKIPLEKMMSQTADEAYTFIRLFFTRHDLFSDPRSRPLLPYLPESRPCLVDDITEFKKVKKTDSQKQLSSLSSENLFEVMLAGPQLLSTFLLIKPSAVSKHLAKILKKIAQECFQIVGVKMMVLTEDLADHVISSNIRKESELFEKHLDHLMSGPSVCLSLQRENAVKRLQDLLGPEDPQSARRQSQFSWRGTFGSDPVMNGLYGACDYNQAVEDQKLFFSEGLCCEESLLCYEMPCPAEDTTIDIHHQSSREICLNHHTHSTDLFSADMAEIHDMLLQTTCLVLTSHVLQGTGREKRIFGYVDIMETLLSHGFELCGARMIWFNQSQAEHFLHLVDAGSFKKVPELTSGPSLVLALQRDNAVLAFGAVLGGSLSSDSVLKKYGDFMYRPGTIKQSRQLLTFFFDHLMPGSQLKIISCQETSS